MSGIAEDENHEEEEEEGVPITYDAILKSCRKNKLYSTPDLNDKLYLHYSGFTRIKNLDKFINIKVLYLNNNNFTTIENLSHLKQLNALYLQQNHIYEISGLEELTQLELLSLAGNFISKIENLGKLTQLKTLELESNRLRTVESIENLVDSPSIEILNISKNQMTGDNFLDVLEQLPNLKVLRLDGNNFTRGFSNYRRKIIARCGALTYLDEQTVTAEDRRLNIAWIRGGKDEEIKEKQLLHEEKEAAHRTNLRDFRRMQKNAALNDGKDLKDFPELFSSDDEEGQKILREKYAKVIEIEDDNNFTDVTIEDPVEDDDDPEGVE